MRMLEILTLPNPLLRQKSKTVVAIDEKVLRLLKEMAVFLKNESTDKNQPRGIGLAAPQVGYSMRIILIWSSESRKILPMINPQIIWKSKRTKLGIPGSKKSLPAGRQAFEGCLSVPGVWGKVRRHSVIKVCYQTPNNQLVIRRFRKLTGVVIQHEIDHLDGILFVDRIIQQKGKIFEQPK